MLFKVTSRVLRLIRAAERTKPTSRSPLTPVDLFIGGLRERTGVLGELFLKGRFNLTKMENLHVEFTYVDGAVTTIPPFQVDIISSVVDVMNAADENRRSYHQILINEGHIYAALLELSEVEQLLQCSDARISKKDILEIVCSPRDMAVRIEDLKIQTSSVLGEVAIRRANVEERESVISFVKTEFGDRWISSLINGFNQSIIPVFIAVARNEIVGFGCYDVVRNGVFGPMGTSFRCREKGIGKALLHHCLTEMYNLGYSYAIIDNAGPIEFYERSCGAVLIPKSIRGGALFHGSGL